MNNLEERIKALPPRSVDEIWSDEQRLALYEEGSSIIVSAGAGSGKTAVLTERITLKIKKGIHLRDLIVLTFTNDAATEMKERVREKLTALVKEDPKYLNELLDLDTAHIQTFDSFSLNIVQTYHYLLDLDSEIAVSDEDYLRMIKDKIFDECLNEIITEVDIQELFKTYTIKDHNDLKSVILSFYDKMEKYPNTYEYLKDYENKFYSKCYLDSLKDEILKYIQTSFYSLRHSLKAFTKAYATGYQDFAHDQDNLFNKLYPYKTYNDFKRILDIDIPRKPGVSKKDEIAFGEETIYKPLFENFRKELKAYQAYFKYDDLDGFIDEYLKTKKSVLTIIKILMEFDKCYNDYLDEYKLFSFNRIAKLAINLLQDNPDLLDDIKNNTKEILVDEYQDTSIIQETLISMISNNNIYMVGDIKQSIYKFRDALLSIFKDKYDAYSLGKGGLAIDLSKNFRSRKEVLNNINLIFEPLMDEQFGGVTYMPNHALRFGFTKYDDYMARNYDMEILSYEQNVVKEAKVATGAVEARIIAKDILKKIDEGFMVYDKGLKALRPATFKDFCILTISRGDYDIYKEIFEEYGIPTNIDNAEKFLESEEITFINTTLKLAYCFINKEYFKDNYKPTLISFLRSFVINKSDIEISKLIINTNSFKSLFKDEYDKVKEISTLIKCNSIENVVYKIIESFDLYNKLYLIGDVIKRTSKINFYVSKALDISNKNNTILDFINYTDYLSKSSKDFDFGYKITDMDAVEITTIHKSKGLEYPHCYFPSLTKKFNISDTYGLYLFSEKYGMILPSFDEGLRKSFLNNIYKDDYVLDNLSEELRLFYVALTRAKESFTLIMPRLNDFVDENPTYFTKRNYKTFNDCLQSISHILKPYENRLDTRLYVDAQIKKVKKPYQKLDEEIKDIELVFKKNVEVVKKASISIDELQSNDERIAIEFGNRLHHILEIVKIKDFKEIVNNIEDIETKVLINSFYKSSLIASLHVINEFHEYRFMYNGVSGIIDLLLETDDKFIIIDYKTKDINKPGYIDQLNIYKDYIFTKTTKEVKAYLYSIINCEFKEV